MMRLHALVKSERLNTVLVMATTKEPFAVPDDVASFRLPIVAAPAAVTEETES